MKNVEYIYVLCPSGYRYVIWQEYSPNTINVHDNESFKNNHHKQ